MQNSRGKIGLVVPAFDKGGLEIVVYNLYRGYKRAGYDCVILVENNEKGYMATRLESRADCLIFNRDEELFLKICRRERIECLHYHYSVFGLTWAAIMGIPTIYTIHNLYTWLEDDEFRERLGQISKAAHVVAVSRSVRDYFCSRSGMSQSEIVVINNGTDVLALVSGDEMMPSDLGIANDLFVFANVASTHRNKHHSLMIAAAEKLAEQRSDFLFLMVGNVGDAAYHEEIAALIEQSPARDQIRLINYLPADRMPGFYRDICDCIILASLQEGCSNVVLEGLATGRPMILTDVGNAREASAMSDRVIVIPPAYPNVQELRPEHIDQYSRSSETRNLDALVDAMATMMDANYSSLLPDQLESTRLRVGLDTMIMAYLRLIVGEQAEAEETVACQIGDALELAAN